MEFYQNNKKNSLQVGIFVLIAFIIFFLAYSWFNNIYTMKDYKTIRVRFNNGGNIQKGSPVTILGVNSGKVEDILIKNNYVVLKLLVKLDFPLKEGTKFIIKEKNLMGDIKVEIIPGNGQKDLNITKTLKGEDPYALPDLVIELGKTTDNLSNALSLFTDSKQLVNKFQSVLDNTNSLIAKLETTFTKNSPKIDSIVVATYSLTKELDNLLLRNKEKINKSVERTAITLTKLNQLLDKFSLVSANIQELTDMIMKEQNTVNKLIKDKELYDNLLRSSSNLDSLLIDIKKNPKKYFEIKVF